MTSPPSLGDSTAVSATSDCAPAPYASTRVPCSRSKTHVSSGFGPHAITRRPSAEKDTDVTGPLNGPTCGLGAGTPVPVDHSLTVPSSPPVASHAPSGL